MADDDDESIAAWVSCAGTVVDDVAVVFVVLVEDVVYCCLDVRTPRFCQWFGGVDPSMVLLARQRFASLEDQGVLDLQEPLHNVVSGLAQGAWLGTFGGQGLLQNVVLADHPAVEVLIPK